MIISIQTEIKIIDNKIAKNQKDEEKKGRKLDKYQKII